MARTGTGTGESRRRRPRPAHRRSARRRSLRESSRQTRCAGRGRRDARPDGRSPGWPTSDRSPMTSRILWRTNSSSNRSALLRTPVSPSTIALSSEPPSARPRWRSISTSFRNPNVRAGAISSTKLLRRDPHRPRLVPQQRMVEADAVGDLEVIRRIQRDPLVPLRERDRPQHLQVPPRRLQPLHAGFVQDQVHERRGAAVHDRHFRVIQLDDHVVDAQGGQRGEQVLDRLDRHGFARQPGLILNAAQVRDGAPESRGRPDRFAESGCRNRQAPASATG